MADYIKFTIDLEDIRFAPDGAIISSFHLRAITAHKTTIVESPAAANDRAVAESVAQ